VVILIINISELVNRYRSSKTFEFDLKPEELSDEHLKVLTPINVKGSVKLVNDELIIDIQTKFSAELNCSRCTSKFIDDYRFEFTEALELKDNQENINEHLDLTELIRDNILINMPTKPMCSQDCKGLCPVCGINKNTNDCNCESEQFDPRLSVLSNLLNEDE
jgi:uncharacterized protein